MDYMTLFVLLASLLAAPQDQRPVFDLSDRSCKNEVSIRFIEGTQVIASCASDGDARIMRISVSNLARAEKGPLRGFLIQFCGPSAIQASGPAGWVAKIEGHERGGDERHSVTWSLPDDLVDTVGIPSGARASEFLVRLKPGWALSRTVSARWGDSDREYVEWTHDCPKS